MFTFPPEQINNVTGIRLHCVVSHSMLPCLSGLLTCCKKQSTSYDQQPGTSHGSRTEDASVDYCPFGVFNTGK